MSLQPTPFYQSHLVAIHALLRAEPLAQKYLSGTGIFIDRLYVHRYFLNPSITGRGLGSVAFGLCAINAHLLGLEEIQLVAAGGVGYSKNQYGFKVWPKLGFDAPLDPDEINGYPQLVACKTV